MKRFLCGWFKFCRFEEIYFDNALEWLAWSLFGDFIDRVPPKEQDELAGYIKDFENHVGQPLQPGYNDALRNGCIRINLDPVSARHRPLVSYAVTYAPIYCCQIIVATNAGCPIDVGSPHSICLGRYTAHAVGWVWLTQAGFIHAQAGEVSYWYRPPAGSREGVRSAPPVVLLHGIGLGLVPYLGLLQRMKNQHGNSSTIICPVSFA